MADSDDNQYKRLPVVLQTTAIKNFFEYTVDQLYSEANVETLNGFIGVPDWDGIRAEGSYIQEETATKQAYSLLPTINTINPESGEPQGLVFYDEVVDILKTYGVDVRNQNKVFDSPYFTFSPPINEDKLLNYSEYYWAPPGANVTPNAIIISGTVESPVDVEDDILGEQYYVHYGETANTTFRNGMVITFEGDYIDPNDQYANVTFVVEGVGESIYLVPQDRNTTAPYDSNVEPSYVVIERGAVNNNGWSRNNYWFHVNNWYDAGEVPPDRVYRAQRPIIEFNKRLETYNQGSNFLQSVDLAVTTYNYNQVNGLPANVDIDGVDPANKTMIFPSEGPDRAPYVYLGVPFGDPTTAYVYDQDPANNIVREAILSVEIAGDPGNGFVDRILVEDGGSGYRPANNQVIINSNVFIERAEAEANIYKGIKVGSASLQINDPGSGYSSNTVSIQFSSSNVTTGIETDPVIQLFLNNDGNVNIANVTFRGGGWDYDSNIIVTVLGANTAPANIVVVDYDSYVESVTITKPGEGYTQFGSIVLEPVANVAVGDSVLITQGDTQQGNEYYYTEGGWILSDTKRTANDAPLFVIYDDTGTRMDDEAKYPQSDFAGNKIFSYATPEDIRDEDAANVAITLQEDPVLGFPLVYRPFKAASEIVFTNNLEHDKYQYTPIGSDDAIDILGYNFYHLLPYQTLADQYYPYWKPSDRPYNQAIISRYQLNTIQIDQDIRDFFIGCIPDSDPYKPSQINVTVTLNGKNIKSFSLIPGVTGFIRFDNNIVFKAGDFLEIIAYSKSGLLSMESASKYEVPLGWDRNIFKENIRFTSEPEYLVHFKTQIESQVGFVGEPLGQNNYQSTAKETSYATEIVQSSSDVVLAGYLLDDQPHNLVDALRFNSSEYGKYKARLKKCINEYYATNAVDENNIDMTLEMILREVIAFRVGKNVFNRTYVVPFGDNYIKEQTVIGGSTTEVVLDTYLDLSLIEHSLLVFATAQGSLFTDMLVVDRDYVVVDFNPITIRLIGDYLGSTITTKLYTAERDSAQCPPTPSVLGIYPLFQPEITIDDTFETPQEVLIGHDGSKTPTYGDARDQILLDFEQRIYNAAKKEFREANSLPELNFFDIRPGYFRKTGYGYTEWYNLMRYHFSAWTTVNKLDPIVNEFYDKDDPWTWNYRGTGQEFPGHWRGLYEYYYDTTSPHTHPWEMLGFTEKPLWWDDEYGLGGRGGATEQSYGSGNTAMWDDLEAGIIRRGSRENISTDLYKLPDNPYARPDLFKYLPVDADGNLLPPNKLPSGNVEEDTEYVSNIPSDWNQTYPIYAESFIYNDNEVYPGVTLSYSGSNVYIQSEGVLNYEPPPGRYEPQGFQVNFPNTVTVGPSDMPVGDGIQGGGLVGVAVNGIAIVNPKASESTSDWTINQVFENNHDYENPGKYDSRGGYEYYIIPPQILDIGEWDPNDHSPIIGWALDGLPIYGPYGYTQYNNDGTIADSTLTNIKSPFVLKSGTRPTSPGGRYSGLYLEDYQVNPALVGTDGYAGTDVGATPGEKFAIRYGVTPESPNVPKWFYVQCQDDNGNPMFPYAVGGGTFEQIPGYGALTYANQFYGTPNDYKGIFEVKIDDCGFGYTGVAGVTFVGDGDNATGYSVIEDGVIRNVIVNNKGKNYDWQTTTLEILGDGTGAAGKPIVIDGQIVGIEMTNFGSGYTFATPIIKQVADQDGAFPGQFAELTIPTVAEDPRNGIVNGAVTQVVVTNKGYGYNYITCEIEAVVGPQPPILTPVLGSNAQASVVLETTFDNSTGNGYVDPDGTLILESVKKEIYKTDTTLLGASWMYSDGAPVENAWKYSENYPFAVAEGLLLGQPAQFATQFSDPTKLYRAGIDPRQQMSTVTRERWQFTDPAQFRIHGERDAEGNFLTNIGYTQFTNSWLAFQGLDTNVEFAPQLRTINMRLSQRMSGYVDKDTMTVRTDQFSATGTTPSLIIPVDNYNIQIHSSPYKTRNFYTGVIVEKSVGGYKVRGYDMSLGTFPTLQIDKNSNSRAVRVGGDPAPFSAWQSNKFYKKFAIVEYRGSFYQAPKNLTTGADFDARLWTRLPSLPQINSAEAEVWSRYLNQVDFVPYETLLKTPQEVVDLLMSLGAWQSNAGYDFQGFDYNTGDSLNWEHAAKQFLFWTTGKWEIGNTLELSPMAAGATFSAPRGFIAKINRIERNQFTLLDADGSAINPEDCEIIRLEDYIQVKPPQGSQIYGMLVFVKEIEHAMTLDNRTDFNDIIYDPILHQYQRRLKIKGKRTAGWTGKLLSEGFIILDDELKPNLDNLAQSMGRYHELGFIPVEKQVYESARALFGYQSRDYMRDLDILDDQQFDFYKGFLQSKGTQTSLTRIGEANSIVIDGNITVYDEWAVSVGEFGDVESQQALEFKLDRSNVTSDPQLVVLEFPEDVTGVVERIDVINRNNTYSTIPDVLISAPITSDGRPSPSGRQATADAYLRSDGKLDYIKMTDKGRGYEFATATIKTQGNNTNGSGQDIEFDQSVAQGGISQEAWAEQPINGNCYINITGTEILFTEMSLSDDGLITSPSNVILFTTSKEYDFEVGSNLTLSGLTGTVCKDDGQTCANMANLNGTFAITSSQVSDAGIRIGFTSVDKVGVPATYGVNLSYSADNLYKFEFDNVYYHEANIDVTPFEWGGKDIEDIINAETANTGVTASMYASHVPNERQPGQSGGQVIDWYTLVLRSDTEFELIEESPSNVWSEQFHIATGTYTNQQRWAIDVASGTDVSDITVIVNGQIIDQCKYYEVTPEGSVTGNCDIYNWNYLAGGDYTGNANVALVDQTLVYSEGNANNQVFLETYDIAPWAPADLDDETSGVLTNKEYPFLELYIGNVLIAPEKQEYVPIANINTLVWQTVWTVDTVNPGLISINTAYLPGDLVDSNTSYLRADLPIKLVEQASIKFTEDFNGDINGSNISIEVTTDDDLLVKIGRERTFEITQDIANDDIIVIDVDDPTRFLKKPTGEMTKQLWPTYDDVNYLGVKDSKDYPTIPNSGYVNSANVNFQAYDIGSLPLLFDPSIKVKPTGGHTIHIASSENQDWNVYELKPTTAQVQFVARQDDRVSLFTNYSLFNYIDGNMIGEDDTGRYLDYYLTLRNADVSDNVVVWTNETIVQQAQSTISNLGAPRMIEARIRSLGPSENSLRRFTDYIPAGDDFYINVEMSASGLGQGQQQNIITTATNVEIVDAGQIESSTDPNTEEVFILPETDTGTGANLSVTWDTIVLTSGIYLSTANTVTVSNGGNNYQVGDLITFAPANTYVGVSSVRVTEVTGVEYPALRSNVITIGRIQNSTIQDGDVIRLINGGKQSTASVLQANISIDYDNLSISFANVSNADDFVPQNTLYLKTSPNPSSAVNNYAYTILDNTSNVVTVTSTSLSNPETMNKLTLGDFGDTNTIRTTNVYDLGEPNVPNDEDTYYSVFNVNTNGTGTTSLQIERPDTFFNLANVTSDIYNIRVETAVKVVANVTGNVFTTNSDSIVIEGYTGALSAMNGVWTVFNVQQNPFNLNEDLITFNTLKVLPVGEYAPPTSAYKTDTSLTVNLIHLNKTRLVMPNVSDINVGDNIKVLGNVFSGTYNADSVVIEHNPELNDNSFTTYVDINAPFILDTNRTGNVLMGGMKIATTNPHGISPEYAAQNKRIAVHFAFPKAYNKIYNITGVDAYNIYVDEVLTQSDETIDFYRYETASVAGNDNVYITTSNPFLTKTTVTYASNSAIVAPNNFIVQDGTITFNKEILPANNTYVTVNIIRELNRSYDRYPVITTVDHNKIRLNGVNFTINSYNSPEAIAENINRAANLMRGWVTPTGRGMQFSFPMVKDYREPVFAPDGSLRPAHTINNYGPYIRDKNTLARIANDPDIDTGTLSISNPNELDQNQEFNKGAIKIGPTKGATYFDTERKTWMLWIQEGPTDTEGGYYPLGVYYDDQNRSVLPKRKKIFKIIPTGHIENGPVLDVIPGSYPVQRNNPNVPGQTQYEYDLRAVKEYSFPALWVDRNGTEVVPQQLVSIQDADRKIGTVKLYRYRLKPSTQGYFEVYEMVELTNGEIIGIKVDSAQPPLSPHNFYLTQTNAGNFHGLASNSINFDTKVSFDASKINLYPSYSGGSLILGPVSPPSDVGKTTIPEPFAIRRSGRTLGNGSDSVSNWNSLPETYILAGNNGSDYTIEVDRPGFDTFNIWQPGLIPGRKNPPNNASDAISVPFGKGRGYYEQGDGNTPEMFQVISTAEEMVDAYDYGNVTMGWSDPVQCPNLTPLAIEEGACTEDPSQPITNDYPSVDNQLGWSTPQPRFMYSKRFLIETSTSNDDRYNIDNDWANSSSYYNTQEVRYASKSVENGTDVELIMGDYPRTSDTTFRPDEIFVACFWTEPYMYRNQIVGYGPDEQNAGNRRPIYKDYYGTITRCKYIRMTELPLDAVTVMPECDTGWGGEGLVDPQQASANSNSNSTAMDLLSSPTDVAAGTSATQNNNINTGAEFTGGVSPEDPNPNEAGPYDANNTQQLPAGYLSQDNNLVDPGEQLFPTLPNSESTQGVGIGLNDTSQVEFGNPGGETPFNNDGVVVNENTQQNTSIVYPTTKNANESPSPVLNPPVIILPGQCDIEPAPEGGFIFSGGQCDASPSSVLAYTASNNYYGIILRGSQWETISQETTAQKYEWHNFGKVANKYDGATRAYVELVCDFRDDTLTAGGVTVVQNKYPFGRLPGGQSFDPRDPSQQPSVDSWWSTATVIDGLNTIPASTPESAMLQYGSDNIPSKYGRGGGTTIPSVTRIGLTGADGSGYNPTLRPSNWGAEFEDQWLTNDAIIGGSNRGDFAVHNSVKGAFAFTSEIDCAQGEYLTVFVHIGHGSGNNGQVLPRYDLWIRYDHNVSGYGGNDGPATDACGDGTSGTPNSAIYASGAQAKAYKSKTTSSTDTSYKTSTAMKAGGSSATITWTGSEGKDETNMLSQGNNPAWLFDNIYFPYNSPARQGTAVGNGGGNSDTDNTNPYYFCCTPDITQGTSGVNVYDSPYCRQFRGEGLCQDREFDPGTGPGGGDGGGGAFNSK